MSLSPLSSGSANIKPEINCELMLPGTLKTPLFSFPLIFSGRPSPPSSETPFSGNICEYSPIGRETRLPLPVNRASTPPAAATGIINLSVLPLSMQSRVAVFFANTALPSTVSTSFSTEASAPSASTQPMVALISLESATGDILHTPPDKAAQMTARWTSLFDGGAATAPRGVYGKYFTFGIVDLMVYLILYGHVLTK